MASNLLVVGVGTHELEVGSTYNVPITVFANYVLTTPLSATLVLRDPSSTFFTFTWPLASTLLTLLSTGMLQFAYTPTLIGRHVYTVTTTTPGLVSSGEFMVIDEGVN